MGVETCVANPSLAGAHPTVGRSLDHPALTAADRTLLRITELTPIPLLGGTPVVDPAGALAHATNLRSAHPVPIGRPLMLLKLIGA